HGQQRTRPVNTGRAALFPPREISLPRTHGQHSNREVSNCILLLRNVSAAAKFGIHRAAVFHGTPRRPPGQAIATRTGVLSCTGQSSPSSSFFSDLSSRQAASGSPRSAGHGSIFYSV